MHELHTIYERARRAYGGKNEEGRAIPANTGILLTLFSQNQPYSDALQIPCDVVLEVVESRLDEGLSYLDKDNPRLARKQIAIEKEFGSVEAFVKEGMKGRRFAPISATL